MKEKDLPALDNIELRKLNTKTVVDTVENIGSYVKTAQKNTRLAIITSVVILSLLLVMVIGSYIYIGIKTKGDSVFDNMFMIDKVSQRYVCNYNGGDNVTFREPKKALEFKELFNNSMCTYYSTER